MTKATLQWSDIPGFINALFSSAVRSEADVVAAMSAGKLYYSFADDASLAAILNAWMAAWKRSDGVAYDQVADAHCPPWDRQVLGFFRDYLHNNQGLELWQPTLTFQQMQGDSSKGIYKNAGYTSQPFFTNDSCNYGTFSADGTPSGGALASFLHGLLLGGHHVWVSSSDDTSQDIGNLYDAFRSSGLFQSHDPKNSHYTTSLPGGTPVSWNGTGWYYQTITGDTTPNNYGLLLALLFGKTSNGATNTFMQLEGWPYVPDSSRHTADYTAYGDTLWNYGTFAACVWSEKRCTPLFVAPSDFKPALNKKTHMPLYNGAGSKQNWMDTDLLQLP